MSMFDEPIEWVLNIPLLKTVHSYFQLPYVDRHDQSALYITGFAIFLTCFVFWFVAHKIVNLVSSQLAKRFIKDVQNPSFTSKASNFIRRRSLDPNQRSADWHILRAKFQIATWRAYTYTCLFSVGILYAYNSSWLFEYEKYVMQTEHYSWFLAFYYNLSLAHYCYSTVELLLNPVRLKDFHVMIVHHLTTIALIFGSYYYIGCVRIGTMVMLVHDISDPFMETAKSLLYAGNRKLADVFFFMFALAFMIPRDWFYPVYVISPLFYVPHIDTVSHSERYVFALSVIFILDLYWSALILKMIWEQCKTGKVGDDIREKTKAE